MLDDQSSLRLKLLRFPPIIGVVYIHTYNAGNAVIEYAGSSVGVPLAELNGFTSFIIILISEGIARIAIPLFFLMAGYLFFITFTWSSKTYVKKITTRLRSLFVPFLFWNVLVLAFMALMQAIPATQPYFTDANTPIADYGAFDYCNALFGIRGYPIAFHFWFIRDLMLLVLLAPLIAVLVRLAPVPFFVVVYVLWVSDTWPIYMPAAVGVFFFAAGTLCGLRDQSLFAFDRFTVPLVLLYLPLLLADVIWYTAWFNNWLHRTDLIVGVLVALCSTRYMLQSPWLCRVLLSLGGASFFVYAAHEPLQKIIRLLAYSLVPLDGAYTMLVLYLTIPLLVMVLLVGCHYVLAQHCPRLLSAITGGR
jgi:surface polysaccharide O-acyltransferase-like enzyme